MAKQIATEEKYEALVKAISGGELQMVKFLWKIIEEIDGMAEGKGKELDNMRERMNTLLERLQNNPPKDGKTPTKKELLEIIRPLIPAPLPGPAGHTPTKRELLELIRPLIPDPIPGEDGKTPTMKELTRLVEKAVAAHTFPMPRHEWKGSSIRFEIEDGEWGPWVNLRGPAGEAFNGGPSGPVFAGIERIRGDGFLREGATELYFGDNLTITRTGNGVRIDAEAGGGGGGGGGLDFETPTGTVDDSNVAFTVTEVPLYLVVNGAQYFEGVHYSRTGFDITLNSPVGTGGFIRSAFGTGISVETPTGTVDDSNTTFTVSNEPKYVVINGAQYFDGAGYTYLAGTIELDNPVGTGGFIRSVY